MSLIIRVGSNATVLSLGRKIKEINICLFYFIIVFFNSDFLWERMGSGVPSGLQNQYEELRASWVSSILTRSRQRNFKSID